MADLDDIGHSIRIGGTFCDIVFKQALDIVAGRFRFFPGIFNYPFFKREAFFGGGWQDGLRGSPDFGARLEAFFVMRRFIHDIRRLLRPVFGNFSSLGQIDAIRPCETGCWRSYIGSFLLWLPS